MSTEMSARGIVGSLRLVGVTAAVAAGIAGFGAAPANAATVDVAADAQLVNTLDLSQVKLSPRTCARMDDANVPAQVMLKLGCIIIPDHGEIEGGPLF